MISLVERGRAGRRRQGGFSLLEMLVVLAVLGLALGLMLGRAPARSPAAELRMAATSLAQMLRLARSQAIAGNRRVIVIFDLKAGERAAGTVRVGEAGATLVFPAGIAVALLAAAGEAAEAQTGGIGFAPDGSSSGGRIILGGAGGARLAVGVDWLTGRVTVADAGRAADAR